MRTSPSASMRSRANWRCGRPKPGWLAAVFATFLLTTGPQARAEHFDFTLTVAGAHQKVEAHADDDPPAEGLNPRPVFHGHTGETLAWEFFMTNVKPHEPFLQLKVRYFLAPKTKAGQKAPPAAEANPVVEGEFILDLKYKDRVGLRQQFHLDRPGLYLLRVETADSHSDHEHFSAIDVEIE